MATLTVQHPVAGGSVVTLTAAGASGDEWTASAVAMLVVDNASAGVVTVTFECYRACDVGAVMHPLVQSVAAGAREFFPPVQGAYVDPATGRAKATCSPITSVTVGVVAP